MVPLASLNNNSMIILIELYTLAFLQVKKEKYEYLCDSDTKYYSLKNYLFLISIKSNYNIIPYLKSKYVNTPSKLEIFCANTFLIFCKMM